MVFALTNGFVHILRRRILTKSEKTGWYFENIPITPDTTFRVESRRSTGLLTIASLLIVLGVASLVSPLISPTSHPAAMAIPALVLAFSIMAAAPARLRMRIESPTVNRMWKVPMLDTTTTENKAGALKSLLRFTFLCWKRGYSVHPSFDDQLKTNNTDLKNIRKT